MVDRVYVMSWHDVISTRHEFDSKLLFKATFYRKHPPSPLSPSNPISLHSQRHGRLQSVRRVSSAFCSTRLHRVTLFDVEQMNEAVLRVKEAVSDDGGVYACKATNGFGSVVVKFHVYVYSERYLDCLFFFSKELILVVVNVVINIIIVVVVVVVVVVVALLLLFLLLCCCWCY